MAQQTLNTPRETTHQRIADALEDIVDKIVDTSSASNIDYDNTQSGLDADKVQGAVDELASEKVDKVQGKGLSTNDYTDTEKQKLAGIEAGANKTVVDSAINDRSTNPLQNRVITAALDEKTDVSNFNALTQEIELFNTYDLSNDVEISVFANDTYKRDKYDRVYETHIPNLDGEYSVSLGDKTFTETCTFTIANQGTSITEVFHTNRKYILGAKLLKAENDEVGDAHVIADVVTLLISKDAPYTTTFNPYFEHPPVTGVLTLKVSVKPDEKYVNKENTGGPAEYAYWGSYNGSDLLINNPILTYSETTFGQPKVSGNPITINDAAEANAVDVSVDIEPVQDLHGYDHPWVGGAGKNRLPMTGSDETVSGVTYTKLLDNDSNVIGIKCVGTISDASAKYLSTNATLPAGTYILTGGSGVSSTGIRLTATYIENDAVKYIDVTTEQGITFTLSAETQVVFYLRGEQTNLAVNTIIYPMIRLATETDPTFEPYSNISPITGQTEVVIEDVGKNLFDSELSQGGIYFDTGNNYSSDIYVRTDFIPLKKGTYTISQNIQNAIRFYDKNKIYNRSKGIETFRTANTITLEDDSYIKIVFRASDSSNITPSSVSNIQLEVGDTATTYEPYKGKTYTIQLGDTIYGGELDVLTGELRVTHGYIESYNGESLPSTWISDRDEYSEGATPTIGAQVVYELATPYTIQLTPQQIRLLKGTNHLSCNTGDLSIKYYPDNVLGQLKGDIESEYDARLERLEQYTDVFGFIEDMDVLSPTERIKYIGKNENYEPLTVDLNTGSYTLGDWGNFPFLVDNKPYMVKPDGTPDYQLNEYDYTKKLDGTDSDVANEDYDGGAFSWGRKIYKKQWMVGNKRHVLFSFDKKDGFHADGFINKDGKELDGRWIPMFYGTVVNGKAKSIATGNCITGGNLTTDAQHNAIVAFDSDANFFGGAFVETLIDLLMMFAKNSDLQAAYGYGNSSGYVNDSSKNYGMLNNAVVGGGQFYGRSDGKTLNKALHSIVLATYNTYMRDPYEVIKNGEVVVSEDYTYDPTGATYTDTGITVPNQSANAWRYPKKYIAVPRYGSIPDISVGGASTSLGRSDGTYTLANQSGAVIVCLRFGDCNTGANAGLSCRAWYITASNARWPSGFALLLDGSAVV